VVKHAHHNFDIDQPGKDTWRHREAGAFEVVVASDRRLALMREFEQPAQLSVHHLLAELYDGVDWVLVEGFKQSNLLKVEVWRAAAGQAGALPDDDFIVAIATDQPDAAGPTLRPVLDLNDPDAVAQWLVDNGRPLRLRPREIRVNAPVPRCAPRRRPGRLLAQAQPLPGPRPSPPSMPTAACWPRTWCPRCRCRRRTTARWTATRCAAPRSPTRRAAAGQPAHPAGAAAQPLQPGTAARIFTGAPVPPGADAIVMQEDTETRTTAACASCACRRPASGSAAAARTSRAAARCCARRAHRPGGAGPGGQHRPRPLQVARGRAWRCSPPATSW
jgi:molybdopterin-guanine dinucleotide biosynthesis protein B